MKQHTKFISKFFTIGSLTWEEACECALTCAELLHDHHPTEYTAELITNIEAVIKKDVNFTLINKTEIEVNKQLQLFDVI